MEDKKESEKKLGLEEYGKASDNVVSNALSWSVKVSETEEFSTNLFLDQGADSTPIELQSSEFHLSTPVQETESSNLLRSTDKPASSYGESQESEFLSIPFQESGSSNGFRSTDEPTSFPFFEDDIHSYSPIPDRLPPTDECQLCSRKFRGNFRQYNVTFCVDCSRFRDFELCNIKDYKRSSGPPMTVF